jgi:hypothetical protein
MTAPGTDRRHRLSDSNPSESVIPPSCVAKLVTPTELADSSESSFVERLVNVIVSIVVLVPVTVFLGYGGWVVLTASAAVGGPDPETADGELLRGRLAAWPERNREVMRTNGEAQLPLRP